VKAGLCSLPADYEWSSRRFLESGSELIDSGELETIASIDDIKHWERASIDERDHEPMAPRRRVYADEDVAQMIERLSGAQSGNEVLSMATEKQQALVEEVRKRKVPIRQISRMTGISKGVLERWGRS
jgi:hypothetical protein